MYSWHLHIVLQNFLMSLLQANVETIKLYITIEFNKKKKKKKTPNPSGPLSPPTPPPFLPCPSPTPLSPSHIPVYIFPSLFCPMADIPKPEMETTSIISDLLVILVFFVPICRGLQVGYPHPWESGLTTNPVCTAKTHRKPPISDYGLEGLSKRHKGNTYLIIGEDLRATVEETIPQCCHPVSLARLFS